MGVSLAGEYFEIVQSYWTRAKAVAGLLHRDYEIAGLFIRLEFAGPALLPMITPALAHVQVHLSRSEPDLTVRLWDSVSTGVAMPPCPCPIEDFTIRGELRGLFDRRYHIAYDGLGRILSLLAFERKSAVVCIFDARNVPTHERGAPLRGLFSWLMRHHGLQLVHAASVGTTDGGVLIVGKGGAGKSNTAVGCLISGLVYAADDFCAVTVDPVPTVYSLYSSAKLRSGDCVQLPFPCSNPEDPVTEKNLYFLQPHFADKLRRCLPILAILMPRRIDNGNPTVHRIPAALPILEMASQTSSMLPLAGGEVLSMLSDVARRLPCYKLELGSYPSRIPDVISALIHSLAKHTRAAMP